MFYFLPGRRSHNVYGQKSLYEQFSTYLTQNGLYMESQLSTDSRAGKLGNQTNLAVKVRPPFDEQLPSLRSRPFLFQSIVAIKAASEIFRILGDNEKSQNYDVRCPAPPPLKRS